VVHVAGDSGFIDWANGVDTSIAAAETTAHAAATFVSRTDGGGDALATNATATGAVTLNLASGNVHNVTLTGNTTFTFSGAAVGAARSFTLILRQDATGSRSVTWPASVKWAGAIAPTVSTAASKVDVLSFVTVDGGTTWLGFVGGIDLR
jgi:hypothetical protein